MDCGGASPTDRDTALAGRLVIGLEHDSRRDAGSESGVADPPVQVFCRAHPILGRWPHGLRWPGAEAKVMWLVLECPTHERLVSSAATAAVDAAGLGLWPGLDRAYVLLSPAIILYIRAPKPGNPLPVYLLLACTRPRTSRDASLLRPALAVGRPGRHRGPRPQPPGLLILAFRSAPDWPRGCSFPYLLWSFPATPSEPHVLKLN